MKNKGFTLIEILLAVVIIAIISTIVITNLFRVTQRGEESSLNSIIKQLDDAAISYALENYYIEECKTDEVPTKESDCAKNVSVKDLIDEAYFVNKEEICDETKSILVYREYETNEINIANNIGICGENNE